ncbi:MAG: TonB-dependent receptor [Candidatus Marinimicrobia bacterium]|nr:TonB-dependent receptor [Candidatus Neomarinimicrobiota bacterium]MBT5538483.1 TonB-dependent receptor [Candidatus Neomarinimicrobiota bacterium]
MQKFIKNTISSVILLSIISLSSASPFAIKGQVIDATTFDPIESVNINVKNTHFGTASDELGLFVIDIDTMGKYVLEISHIGYENKIVTAKVPGNTNLTIPIKESFFEMDDLVVTATRTPKILQNVPVATEVITQQDILGSGARDMGELLSLRSGVSVSSSVAGGSVINIMGVDSKYILVLVDGQPTVGKFDSRASLDQIPISMVKKVEIIKGPNSSLYGSEAMGGVINIITHTPPAGLRLSGSLRYNSGDGYFKPHDLAFGNRSAMIQLSMNRKKLQLSFVADGDLINVNQTNQYIDLDDADKISLTSKIKYQISNGHSLNTVVTNFLNNEYSHSSTESTETNITRNAISLLHSWSVNNTWEMKQVLRMGEYERTYTELYPWDEIKQINLTGEDESEYEISAVYVSTKSTLNIGAEFTSSTYKSDRISSGKQDLFAKSIYGQYDYTPIKSINMVYGIRLDDNSEIDPVVSPRVAMMIPFGTRWKFRAMWGKGFRMPSFMERYIEWNHYAIGYSVVGNPNLKPETSNGYSAGVEYYHSKVYRVSCMVYRTYFKNMIDDYTLPDSIGLLSYRNISKVEFTSVELQGSWNISPQWVAGWGFNYVNNVDLKSNEQLPNTNPFSGNLKIKHKHAGHVFNYTLLIKWIGPYRPTEYDPFDGEYIKSDKYRGSQFLVDYTANVKLFNNFSLDVGIKNINNVTNEKYGPFIGRTYFTQINYKLNGEEK